ncbi:acetate/propionate family kinase [Albidovulum sediminicola]|uniref:Acetate kinase n=1 Tax=Albidovulum sediminicola TaxID=2984331 RepID=A0ABT2Z140_9RHOB|nr:acetate/propionate family kinase [Defluviimonas sp. WL0075]MCV2864859.1 acetate/propionate family kinase [Defluviimonas sp. WL0075]
MREDPALAPILVANAGSSSLKVRVFAATGETLFAGIASEIGGHSQLTAGGRSEALPLPDHADALAALLSAAEAGGFDPAALGAAAHRVVHGGPDLAASAELTPDVLARAEAASALAPLHNPPALAVIAAVARAWPGLRQVAAFDTAFHATIPEVGWRYALPDIPETRGIRRYGFHGLSYASLVARLPSATGLPLPRRLLAAHLGNGASICAIRDGRSVATTMGYSPLGGLTMGTRTGEIDGNAVLEIARRSDINRAAQILNRESGLKALGGASDMRALEAAGTKTAAFAIDHFIHWAIHQAGAMVADMGGCDAVVFTGGIGENSATVRAGILGGLAYLGLTFDPEANARGNRRLDAAGSRVLALIHPADEESWIAEEARQVISGS